MTQPVETWTAKDPDARFDYLYTIPLDDGDSVASHTLVKVSGTAVIDTQSRSGAEITTWISGGTNAETNVFRAAWVTVVGREDEAIILLPIVSSEYAALDLTGFAKPSAAHFVMHYPDFADVPVSTIAYWLTDAERSVSQSWVESDYAAGLMALAAHNMALKGLGAAAAITSGIPAGITQMKSADLSLSFDSATAKAKASGSFGATIYGEEYVRLRRRNLGGPRVMGTGTVPYDGLRYPQGEA